MTSFSISEDGQLYSALTSNNTCALLDVGVSQGKAAWEFLLEDDSPRYVRLLECVVHFLQEFESPEAPNANGILASTGISQGHSSLYNVQPIPIDFLAARVKCNANSSVCGDNPKDSSPKTQGRYPPPLNIGSCSHSYAATSARCSASPRSPPTVVATIPASLYG